jgi:hypothetical protein
MVGLTDEDDTLQWLRAFPLAITATLTATPVTSCDASRATAAAPPQILATGVVFDDTEGQADTAYLIGLRPDDGRATEWLDRLVLQQLTGRPVRLHLRATTGGCDCAADRSAPHGPTQIASATATEGAA